MAVLNQKPGYAVLEVNKLQSRTTGNMVANAPLATDFVCNGKTGASQEFAENGMLLAHLPNSSKGNRYGAIVGAEVSGSARDSITAIGLVWATEHMYNPYENALQNFKIDRPMDPTKEAEPYEVPFGQQNHFQFYPRLYMLSPSDTFTTDAIDLGSYANLAAVKAAVAAGPVYVEFNNGYSKLVGSKSNATYGVVEKVTTLPDGISPAIKVRVISGEIKLVTDNA